MQPIHILIVDENIDFARSLGNLIADTLGEDQVRIKYAYSPDGGIAMVRQSLFQFVFIGTNFALGSIDEIKTVFGQLSANPLVKIIAASFNNDMGFRTLMEEAGASQYLVKDEIGVEELTTIFNLETKD